MEGIQLIGEALAAAIQQQWGVKVDGRVREVVGFGFNPLGVTTPKKHYLIEIGSVPTRLNPKDYCRPTIFIFENGDIGFTSSKFIYQLADPRLLDKLFDELPLFLERAAKVNAGPLKPPPKSRKADRRAWRKTKKADVILSIKKSSTPP